MDRHDLHEAVCSHLSESRLNKLDRKHYPLVAKVAKELEWDVNTTAAFVVDLLEDVNLSRGAHQVDVVLFDVLKKMGYGT